MKAKKIASLLLAVLMLVSMLALPVSATEADVAKIGEETYATLEDAFADAPNKATITLLSDVTLTSSIEIGNGMDITVEGAGKTITGADNKDVFLVLGGKLTLAEGLTVVSNTDCAVVIKKQGAVLNTEANLVSHSTGYAVVQGSGNEGMGGVTVNVTGGTITSDHMAGIYFPNTTELNISGGTITGTTAVYHKSGKLTITGGTLAATGAKVDYKHNANGCNETGDALVIESCNYPGGDPTASITGGTFTSKNAHAVATYTANDATAPSKFIKGGTFDELINDTLIAEGYECVESGEDFVVSKIEPVAAIGDNTFITLADAIAAAPVGGTITLLKDTVTGVFVDVGGNCPSGVVFDLNGFTLTLDPSGGSTGTETNGFRVLKGNTATVKNGKVVAEATETNPVKVMFANYGTLTLNSVEVVHNGKSDSVAYTINNCGKLDLIATTVTNNIECADADWDLAMTVGDYAYGNYSDVNVDRNSVINGMLNIEGIADNSTSKMTFAGTLNGTMRNDPDAAKGSKFVALTLALGSEYSEVPSDEIAYAFTAANHEFGKLGDMYVVGEHNPVTVPAKASTCTTKGNPEYTYCDTCGRYAVKGMGVSYEMPTIDIDKDAHTPSEIRTGIVPATHEEAGYTGDVLCVFCDDVVVTGVVVPKLEKEVAAPVVDEEAHETVTKEIQNIVGAMTGGPHPDKINTVITEETKKAIEEAYKSVETTGETVVIGADIVAQPIQKEEIEKEEVKAIEEKAAALAKDDEEVVIASYLDISVFVVNRADNNKKLGNITELEKPVEIQIVVPESLRVEGAKYVVVHYHDGKAEIIEGKYKDGVLTIKTDKFSTYALAVVTMPTTGESGATEDEKEEEKEEEPTASPSPSTEPTATPAPTTAPTATPAPTAAPTATAAPTKAPSNVPATGDESNVFALCAIMAMSAAAAYIVLKKFRKA